MMINQLKAGAALNYVSIMLNMVVGLVYTPYMLRMLGQSEYGLYSLAASIIAYLTVLDLGFGNAIVRYTAKFEAEGKKREHVRYVFSTVYRDRADSHSCRYFTVFECRSNVLREYDSIGGESNSYHALVDDI